MQREESISGRFRKASVVGLALLMVLVTLGQDGARAAAGSDYTLYVRIEGKVRIELRNAAAYFLVLPDKMEKGKVSEEEITLQEGAAIQVKIREGLDIFRFAEPVTAVMNAPVYLGKTVFVDSLLGKDVGRSRGMIYAGKEGLRLKIKKGGRIAELVGAAGSSSQTVSFMFDETVIARTKRTIGVKPFIKRTFKVPDRWLSEGEEVRIIIPMAGYDEKESQLAVGFWTDHSDSGLEEAAYLAHISGIEQESVGDKLYAVKARVPSLGDLSHVTPPWYCPYPPEIKMTVTTKLSDTDIVTQPFNIHVSRRGWGLMGGTIFLVIVFLLIMHITKNWSPFDEGTKSYNKYKEAYKDKWMKRFLFSPLDFSMTPIGTYSISKTQALFWTFLVGFSCVYVYLLQCDFIMIPAQILVLLGITGGTALASRINALNKDVGVPKDIMDKVKKKVQNKGRIPRLRDMVSIGGRLNIYKFQMVVFTLITGAIVFSELLRSFNFPEIPDSLIVLMGVSNTLYMGNEVSLDPMKKVREAVDALERAKNPTEPEKEELRNKIEEALLDCYQIN
ncbi:MAG: hypothetical protein JRL30_14410 [Deltaproteobacteria bacterium]|nr:hypothetical protein [Deltaproteobacteria bacterium]